MSEKLRDQFYFHTRPKRNLSHPEGATNVQSCISKYFSEKFRSSIGYHVLFGECLSAVHQHHQFDNALDLVEVAHRGMKCAHQIDGHASCGLLPLFGGEIPAQLADPGFAGILSDMTRKKKQIAGAQEGNKSCHRRGGFWKCDLKSVERAVYGHGLLLAIEFFSYRSNHYFGHSLDASSKGTGRSVLDH